MKSILLTITAFTLFIMTALAQTTNPKDDAAITELINTMVEGWKKKDGALFAKPFSEDADYVVINGMFIKGRKAIAEGHQTIFDSFYKETFIKAGDQTIRYLRPDVAIVHFSSHMTGVSNGQKVDARGQITIVAEKTAAGWQIVAFQNTGVQANPGR